MKITHKILNADKIVEQLRNKIKEIEDRSKRAIETVGLRIERESKQRVPRVTSNLFKSGTTRFEDMPNFKSYAVVSYGMSYAVFVHENVGEKLKGKNRPRTNRGDAAGSNGQYWGPNGMSKYLESVPRDFRPELQQIVSKIMWGG
jgi:hypothetical protein|tara:strand:- start:65 stop:499 length:435 start_codon:yes stop_codon:yes gene_type:complete